MTTLSEADSRHVAASAGIPVSPFVTGRSADEVVAAAETLEFPVVAKLCGPSIAHKTERGLVRLGLTDADGLRRAADELLAAARPDDGPVEVLVSSMIQGNRELIAGLTTDPQFGPVVMLGIGGIFAEAIADVAFRLAPVEPADAHDLIDDLATAPLLGPFRGEPPVDRDELAGLLVGLSRLIVDRPDIVAVDLNPLIVADGHPIAVDALVEVADPAPAEATGP